MFKFKEATQSKTNKLVVKINLFILAFEWHYRIWIVRNHYPFLRGN